MFNKVILTLGCLFLFTNSYAQNSCKVYGISDSPQGLTCRFKNKEMMLICKEGKYFFNNLPVLVAFHLEVEDGPTPLVFKTDSMTLTVTLKDKVDAKAEIETKTGIIFGTCKKI
jgi:hypothetical protein